MKLNNGFMLYCHHCNDLLLWPAEPIRKVACSCGCSGGAYRRNDSTVNPTDHFFHVWGETAIAKIDVFNLGERAKCAANGVHLPFTRRLLGQIKIYTEKAAALDILITRYDDEEDFDDSSDLLRLYGDEDD